MTYKKQILALAAAAALAVPSAAQTPGTPTGYSTQPGIIAILIGLLLPAVQKVREAA